MTISSSTLVKQVVVDKEGCKELILNMYRDQTLLFGNELLHS